MEIHFSNSTTISFIKSSTRIKTVSRCEQYTVDKNSSNQCIQVSWLVNIKIVHIGNIKVKLYKLWIFLL